MRLSYRLIGACAVIAAAFAVGRFGFPLQTASVLAPPPTAPDGTIAVTTVVDGDTIEIEGGIRVRMIGVNTPETVDPRRPVQCFGVQASRRTHELLDGARVHLVKDISDTDKYGRLLRYVYLADGTFVNLLLIRDGYAHASAYPPDVAHQAEFEAAQAQARAALRGLWGACTAGTPASAPDTGECVIKGNISSGGRIYHLPGCPYYEKTNINENDGERWFCSEADAVAAGWRKAAQCD